MNSELIPAVVAAGGGSVLATGIWIHEYRAEQAMRASRVRLALTFPAGATPLGAKAGLCGIAGLPDRFECIFEVNASEEGIRHFLLVPAEVRDSVVSTLAGALPGLRTAEAPAPEGHATLAARVFIPTPAVLVTENPEAAARTMLTGIAGLAPGEHAVVRWAIRGGNPRPLQPKEPLDRTARNTERAWRQKTASGPGFQMSGLVLVRAGSVSRARAILEHLTSSLRSRRGPVGALRITTERGNRGLASEPKTTRSSGWVTAGESLGLLAWPLGEEAIQGVEIGAARELPVPRHVPRDGLRLLIGRDSQGERPVALNPEAARVHLGLFGKTGSGKSTVLSRVIIDALAQGYGGVLLDPKDLVPELLDQIPAAYADRVVVLNPSAPGPVPGLDLFSSGGDPSLRSDVILSVLKGLSDGWGPRIERFLHLGLRSLTALPNPSFTTGCNCIATRFCDARQSPGPLTPSSPPNGTPTKISASPSNRSMSPPPSLGSRACYRARRFATSSASPPRA